MNPLVLILVTFISTSFKSLDIVHMRDSSKISCSVVSWSKDGLRITQGAEEQQIVLPWHTVRLIESEEVGASFDLYLSRGELLWRAKSRLLRGDIALALPLFEEAFSQLQNAKGGDAHLAAEGLLRCQVAFGNIDQALLPWLLTLKHYEMNQPTPFPSLAPIIDETSLLCPYLPPVWGNAFIKQTLSSFSSNLPILHEITEVLRKGADASTLNFQGSQFLHNIYVLMDPVHPKYIESLRDLETNNEFPAWKVAWLTYASAVGLLKQEETQNAALLKFAEVASTFGTLNPWIAGSAMSILAEQLEAKGETKAAANVLAEMKRVFPNHPLLRKSDRRTY